MRFPPDFDAAAARFGVAARHPWFQDNMMHRYRSHTCAALNKSDVGQTVRLSGWVTASATMAACCSSTFAITTA